MSILTGSLSDAPMLGGGGETTGLIPIVTTYAFPAFRRILPAGGDTATGVSTGTDIVVEFDPIDSLTEVGAKIYPDLAAMWVGGTKDLKQHASVGQPQGGWGLLYTVTGNGINNVPVVGQYIPCTIDYEQGYDPALMQQKIGGPMRFRINPKPGGSTTASLPDNSIIELLLERQLPGRSFAV